MLFRYTIEVEAEAADLLPKMKQALHEAGYDYRDTLKVEQQTVTWDELELG